MAASSVARCVAFTGTAINVNEDVSFNVQVTNTGPLDVNDLSLRFEGLNDTEVKASGAAAQWVPEFTDAAGLFPKVPAHSGDTPVKNTTSPNHFRATKKAANVADLVKVSVAGWNTDLAHLEVSHTRADVVAAGVYSHKVAAS